MPNHFCFLMLSCLTLVSAFFGADTAAAQVVGPVEKFSAAYNEAAKLYEQKRFSEAATRLEPFFDAGPQNLGQDWYSAMYDLACDEALAGRKDKALDVLEASQGMRGVVTSEHLTSDLDLTALHDNPRFLRLVEVTKSHEHLWSSEPGQEIPYASDLPAEAKIAGLSTFWSEARFNFAFFDRQPELDWNQLYLDFLPKVLETKSTESYYRVLIRFAAELKDGHTNVYPPKEIIEHFYARPGLTTRLVESKVVVTAIPDPYLEQQGWRVGDVVLKIGEDDV